MAQAMGMSHRKRNKPRRGVRNDRAMVSSFALTGLCPLGHTHSHGSRHALRSNALPGLGDGPGMKTSILIILIQGILILLLAPLVSGVIKKLKAAIQMRRGAGILQPYYDVIKLL